MSEMKENTLFFEDFTVGMEKEFGGAVMTKEAIIDFASQFDPQPFHIDEEAALESVYGGLIASGWHTAATVMRLLVDESLGKKSGSRGSGGVDELRWLKPVRPGDTIRVRSHIFEVRESASRPDRGIVRSDYTVLNQHDEEVMTMRSMGFFLKRNPPA